MPFATRIIHFFSRILPKQLENIDSVKSLKILSGVFLLGVLLDYHPFDPTPFNLLIPMGGIRNVFGLPGALISGLLMDFLGYSAFLIPVYLIFLKHRTENRGISAILPGSIAILTLVTAAVLLLPLKEQSIHGFTGIWGYVSGKTLAEFPGGFVVLPVLVLYQFVFIRDFRFDRTSLMFIRTFFLFLAAVAAVVFRALGTYFRRMSKFGAVKWIQPAQMFIQRSFKSSFNRLFTAISKARYTIQEFSISRSPGFMKSRPVAEENSLIQFPRNIHKINRYVRITMKAFEEYKRTYYLSDCTALKEKEI